MQSNAISTILNLMCHGPLLWRRPAHVGWTLVPSRERLLTGERVITCRTSSIETSRKLQSSRPSWRTYNGGGGGSTHFFNLLDEELGKFVGVMSVEDDTGLCHVTRLMKMTARARGHTIFKWSTIVTILHLFRDSPPYTQRLKSRKIHTTPVFEALLGVTPVRIP